MTNLILHRQVQQYVSNHLKALTLFTEGLNTGRKLPNIDSISVVYYQYGCRWVLTVVGVNNDVVTISPEPTVSSDGQH